MNDTRVKQDHENDSALEPRPATLVPRFSLEESEDAIVLRVELPGARLEDVQLTLEERRLALRARRPSRRPEGFRALGGEFFDGEATYERSFLLPDDVDPANVEAELRDGVLVLTLRRTVPERRSIPVRGT